MERNALMRLLCNGPVIPAARNVDDFKYALTETSSPSVIILFGDILTLPDLVNMAKQHHKRLLVHFDLIGGIGKDKAGLKYLSRMGIHGVITTKAQLVKVAREEGMIVIQRLFLVDSEALHTGLGMLKNYQPDALEVLPASIPASAVNMLIEATGLPILAGGLMQTKEEICIAISNGISAVSASKRSLWNVKLAEGESC